MLIPMLLLATTTPDVGLRAGMIASVCLLLWLTERLPMWVPTLILLVATPLFIGTVDSRFGAMRVLGWSFDPILALFVGGFAFAAAAHRQGVDAKLAGFAMKHARGSAVRLVVAAATATTLLSMWMSNVAAAALMLAAFKPIWDAEPAESPLRRAMLLAIAFAADFGGIATPIGTGPNGIAMAAVSHVRSVGFLHWMVFGVPLAIGLVAFAMLLVLVRLRHAKPLVADISDINQHALPTSPTSRGRLGVIFGFTVLLWLTEPIHGIRAWMVSLAAVAVLLAARVLSFRDVVRMDWGTLLLIAGGIVMGALLDTSGVVRDIATTIDLNSVPPTVRLFTMCLLSAALSSLMSNTGSAALLIPLAITIVPTPSTAILIAVACSLGAPFVVSTPPNAMAVAGGLRSVDLLWPGLILMVGGCVIVTLTGPWVLRLVGIP